METRLGLAGMCMLLLVGVVGMTCPAKPRSAPPELRWVFLHSRLVAPGGLEEALGAMRSAADAGYNGIVLGDATLAKVGEPRAAEQKAYDAVKQTAKALGLEIIATVFHPGWMLARDPNLAEGLPVRDAPFVVSDGLASLASDQTVDLQNARLSGDEGGLPIGWSISPTRSEAIAIDSAVRHDGKNALRFASRDRTTDIGSASIAQSVAVKPFRQYHLSAWVRTEGFDAASSLHAQAVAPDRRDLAYPLWRVQRTMDWQRFDMVFNSLEHTRVDIRIGVWSAKRGRLWLSDVRLEPVGILNLLRRPGCPLVVRGANGELFVEGRDYEAVRDPRTGRTPAPGAYDEYHEPPAGIRLTAGSRIRDNARLKVSYYACQVIRGSRATQCLSDPKLDEIMREEIRRIDRLMSPRGYFIGHDEMRVINWCAGCRGRRKTPGALLADNVRRACAIIREVHPGARIAAWSDMFDPHHNARDRYYLVNGSLAGSWKGLPDDAIIANWNEGRKVRSMEWFSDRGFRQLIAGYYDKPVNEVAAWRSAASGIRGVDGFMYTTWVRNYSDIASFARAAWDRDRP